MMLLILMVALAAGCSTKSPGTDVRYDAIVDSRFEGTDGELVDGVKRFKTIQAAIVDAPSKPEQPYTIFIKKGNYPEKIVIAKPNITLIGEDRDETIVSFDGPKSQSTLAIVSTDITIKNLTILNTFDYMTNRRKSDDDLTKITETQALAVKIDGNTDRIVFHNCRLSSYQDTLFVNQGRNYFHQTIIEGAVDFIYGGARAIFDECTIVSLDRGESVNGYITAASTNPNQEFGFVIMNSRLVKESPSMLDNSVALGRPWRNSPQVVYLNNYMDSHIMTEGWVSMHELTPEDARFFEYENTGPGAVVNEHRKQLTAEEAQRYTIEQIFDGWVPGI